MTTYITELDVSLNDTEASYLRTQDFKQIYVNLNMNGSPEVYLWYKEGSSSPITRIQFSFTDSMAEGLNASGFEKVKKNLNTGSCGDNVFLWYFKGTTESHVPITEIEVSRDDEARKFSLGWERMSCNLNRGTGRSWAFLWVKREKKTYIQDMKVTDGCDNDQGYLEKGYIRVDESTNRSTSGKPVFLWYLPTIKMEGSYVSLKVSTNDKDCQRYQKEGFLQLTPPVNLNEGNQGNKVYLWYKKEDPGHKPIQTITLLSNQKLIADYMKAGVTVLQENLNSGCGCPCFPATPLFLGYYN
ncbi:uncharacterized protein LOC118564913 [Fundulus heteroclitus]|uniref:uncharacterized protein LOC118564913 n=1 Tax=Fundulus heteroclitus TaxID=8078 RepID=UPI00165BFAD9|nr:uncharacterized protein LOC118564913 [Fundulus heteroclitus]